MIYFIKTNNEIKIGKTNDLERRMTELQVGNHVALEPLYVIENVDDSFETYVHEICGRFHIKGEWFKIEVLDHLLKHPWYKANMKPYSVK